MLPTSIELAQLCNDTYAYPGDPPRSWTTWEPGGKDSGGVCFGHMAYDDCDAIAFRGSTTLDDWLDDFDFIAMPTLHAMLGGVHTGFLTGMAEAWNRIAKLRRADKPLVLTGHSLGAARATVAAGFAITNGVVPAARVVFGEPYPGFGAFSALLRPIKRLESYCNRDLRGHDRVTDVPFPKRPLWPYTRPSPLIYLTATPSAEILKEWMIFAWHHMPLYLQAMRTAVLPGEA